MFRDNFLMNFDGKVSQWVRNYMPTPISWMVRMGSGKARQVGWENGGVKLRGFD